VKLKVVCLFIPNRLKVVNLLIRRVKPSQAKPGTGYASGRTRRRVLPLHQIVLFKTALQLFFFLQQ